MRFRAIAVVFVLGALALAGCDDEPEGPPPGVADDIDRLRLVMIEDPAQQVLVEVERVVDDRPVFAAQLLRTGGIPAARRQVEAVERVPVDSDVGQRTKRELRAAYDARLRALQQYERVLAAAASDDAALLEALHAQSQADQQLLAVHQAMDALSPSGGARPEEPGGPPAGEPDEAIEGEEAEPR